MLTVPETGEVSVGLIKLVIFLVKNKSLRVDEWLRRVKVQWGFKIDGNEFCSILNGTNGTINQIFLGVCAIWNIPIAESRRAICNGGKDAYG